MKYYIPFWIFSFHQLNFDPLSIISDKKHFVTHIHWKQQTRNSKQEIFNFFHHYLNFLKRFEPWWSFDAVTLWDARQSQGRKTALRICWSNLFPSSPSNQQVYFTPVTRNLLAKINRPHPVPLWFIKILLASKQITDEEGEEKKMKKPCKTEVVSKKKTKEHSSNNMPKFCLVTHCEVYLPEATNSLFSMKEIWQRFF